MKVMKLISEAEYKSLLSKNIDKLDPKVASENATENILKGDMPDDIKLALFMQLSHELSQKVLNMHKQTNIPKPNLVEPVKTAHVSLQVSDISSDGERSVSEDSHISEFDSESMIQRFPSLIQTNVRIVLQHLANREDLIKWDSAGLVTFFETENTNSNLYDMIGFLVRNQHWTRPPVGANRFLLVCKKLGVPISVVCKRLRSKYSSTLETLNKLKSQSESFNVFNEIKSKLINWSAISNESDEGEESEDFFEPVATSSQVEEGTE